MSEEVNMWGEPAKTTDLGRSRRGMNNRRLALHRPTVSRVKIKPYRLSAKPSMLSAYRFDHGR